MLFLLTWFWRIVTKDFYECTLVVTAWNQNELDNEDTDLWQDDWGDEDLDKNFENQLRNEITKEAMKNQGK